jgi:trehalose 6-phosphate synthase
VLDVTDDYARSLALYRVGDVLLVNPVRDGMNLVAKEVPLLSENGCVVVLSTEAGVADEFGDDALLVNPFDVSGTADALDRALSMDTDERSARTKRLADVSAALPPSQWLADQVSALD